MSSILNDLYFVAPYLLRDRRCINPKYLEKYDICNLVYSKTLMLYYKFPDTKTILKFKNLFQKEDNFKTFNIYKDFTIAEFSIPNKYFYIFETFNKTVSFCLSKNGIAKHADFWIKNSPKTYENRSRGLFYCVSCIILVF